MFYQNALLNWYSWMIFLIPLIFDIENWLWKYNFGTFWQTIIQHRIVLKQFPLSVSILGQKSCISGPTIFKITQQNWPYLILFAIFRCSIFSWLCFCPALEHPIWVQLVDQMTIQTNLVKPSIALEDLGVG